MPTYLTPGVYVEEVRGGPRPIQAVGTSVAAFVGEAPDADVRVNEPTAIGSWSQFVRTFVPEGATSTPLSHAVYGFFENGGRRCYVVNVGRDGPVTGGGRGRQGLETLAPIDEIAIVAAPGRTDPASYDALLSHCERLQDRVAILDAAPDFDDISRLTEVAVMTTPERSAAASAAPPDQEGGTGRGLRPRLSPGGYGAFYAPWLTIVDPLAPRRELVDVPPSGHIAGIWARTDALYGVHKAPANEPVRGAANVTYRFTAEEQAVLNPEGVNCIRSFSRTGILVWGARTLDEAASEWRYLNVRRLNCMIREAIVDGTRWVVFQPNDYILWKSIRRDVGAFLTRVWSDGALMGRTAEEAFFVKCDEETNPPEVINEGMVVAEIGIAVVKPAEFLVFRLSQYAGGAEVEAVGAGSNGRTPARR